MRREHFELIRQKSVDLKIFNTSLKIKRFCEFYRFQNFDIQFYRNSKICTVKNIQIENELKIPEYKSLVPWRFFFDLPSTLFYLPNLDVRWTRLKQTILQHKGKRGLRAFIQSDRIFLSPQHQAQISFRVGWNFEWVYGGRNLDQYSSKAWNVLVNGVVKLLKLVRQTHRCGALRRYLSSRLVSSLSRCEMKVVCTFARAVCKRQLVWRWTRSR